MLQREEAPIRRLILRYVRDHATADDLFQEISIKVLDRLHTVRDQASLRGWLFQLARNACLDHLRKQDRRPSHAPLLLAEDGSESSDAIGRNPSEMFCSRERIAAVHKALSELPASQREVLLLRITEGMDHQAIASHLGISRQAVEVRLCRGRAALKNRLLDILEGDL